MKTAVKDTIKTITTQYIDGAFVESHGREVINIIRPTDGQVIAHVTLGDEEDTRRAIAAAKRAFATYGQSTKEERAQILRRLHEAASARLDDLTAAMVEEYGGVAVRRTYRNRASTVSAAEKALQERRGHAIGTRPRSRWSRWRCRFDQWWNANALFICLCRLRPLRLAHCRY
jgi:aldehyde dehydrogenase (NAD+)